MFFLIMITPGIIVISVSEELSKHLLHVVQGFLLGLRGLLLNFQPSTEVIITVISHTHDTLSVRTELTVAEEAYPLSSPSSSDHWNNLFIGSGEVILVEEDGCS